MKGSLPALTRERIAGPTLTFTNITYRVKKPSKTILSGLSGSLPSNTLTAILGPSGSGKTSLLNIIAGRIASGGGKKIKGTVALDGVVVDAVKESERFAYVMQDDTFPATVTPSEALRFSAKLRRPNLSDAEVHSLVREVQEKLGLMGCKTTMVGDELVKGISGGERKRLSIGVELVTRPSILLLDEPTSGLDSFMARTVIEYLRLLSRDGSTTLCTIHQPSSEVFNLFDNVVVLKSGRIVYSGPIDDIQSYFSKFGFELPKATNLADFVMRIIQETPDEKMDELGMFQVGEDERGSDAGSESESLKLGAGNGESAALKARKASFALQLKLLTTREFLVWYRNKAVIAINVGIAVVLNLIFGVIFYQAANSDFSTFSNVNNSYGAVTLITINALFGPSEAALFQFPRQRPVFLREFASGLYNVFTYFIAKLLVELGSVLMSTLAGFLTSYWLIGFNGNFFFMVLTLWFFSMSSSSLGVLLGCATETTDAAIQLETLIFVPQILFTGIFVSVDAIPGK